LEDGYYPEIKVATSQNRNCLHRTKSNILTVKLTLNFCVQISEPSRALHWDHGKEKKKQMQNLIGASLLASLLHHLK
jgi:hypothetical protein